MMNLPSLFKASRCHLKKLLRQRPKMYIIARTNFSSQGMKASQLGADDVIKAEQAVALQFYDRIARHIYAADIASTAR